MYTNQLITHHASFASCINFILINTCKVWWSY